MNATEPLSRELVWDIYQNLTGQCQHFNGIESTYRTLASTWLLAAFAGMGFVLKDMPAGDAPLLVGLIAVAAAVGIFLVWLMDLMVYHRLLSAVFSEQLALEKRHAWLPQVAHGMMNAHGGAGVVPKIVWFYIASYAVMAGIAVVFLVRALAPAWLPWMQLLGMAIGFAAFGVGVAAWMWASATTRSREQETFGTPA